MSCQRYSLTRFCLATVLMAAVFYQSGCSSQKPVTVNTASTSDKTIKPKARDLRYDNDLDRLEELTTRINGAYRRSYVVTLGAGDTATVGGLITVDYALFDRLSDDGAAVLIAESITAGSSQPPQPSQASTQAQSRGNIVRAILQADESVGRHIARAGFDPTGFTEWLEAKENAGVNLQQNSVPEKMRIAAFMRGYLSVGRRR